MDYSEIIHLATPRQEEYIAAVKEYGGIRAAARELGICHSAVIKGLRILRKKAAKAGISDGNLRKDIVPEGYHVKGVSSYIGEDGTIKGQWIKTALDKEQLQAQLLEFTEALRDEVKGLYVPTKPNKSAKTANLTVYPIADPHIGLYCWADECGDDFDVEIATRNLLGAVKRLVDGAEPSEECLIVNLGDFFHTDSPENRTARSGHALDVDTRQQRVMRLGAAILRKIITCALVKHGRVRVVNVVGNHDDCSALALTMIMEGYFEKEPRVTIDNSASPHRKLRFGKVLLGMTHGHTVKPDKLPLIMADEWSDDWGRTKFRHWLTGHIHTQNQWEFRGCLVESFRTLAAADAWHTASGYRAGRDMQRITYHPEYGEIERGKISLAQLT
jgi:predicted phosphodiesterase